MLIFIYYALLFLLQIYMLIKIMKNKENNTFSGLIASIMLSAGYVLMGFGSMLVLEIPKVGFGGFLAYLILGIIALCVYATMLVISIICKIIRSRNLKKQNIVLQKKDKKAMRNRIIKYFLVTLVIFILFIGIDTLIIKQRHYIQERNELIKQNEIKEYVIDYLNENYGDGDFEIIDIKYIESWFYYRGHYKLIAKTSYFDEEFIITVEKNVLEVIEDEFDKYYNGNKQFINEKQ